MSLDKGKIDQAVLALLYLGLHDGARAWKGFDWEVMDRLHEKGFITDPRSNAKSVVFTEEGMDEAQRCLEQLFVSESGQRMWIMIAGPYRSGSSDPSVWSNNLRKLNSPAVAIFQKGHVPIIGVNMALPIIDSAGQEFYETIMLPLSLCLTERCDAILRIEGKSIGADAEVDRFRARGLRVFQSLDENSQPSLPNGLTRASNTRVPFCSRAGVGIQGQFKSDRSCPVFGKKWIASASY